MQNIALRWARRQGKSDFFAVKAIHHTYTNGDNPNNPEGRPGAVLITAPFENQVKLIFKRIREFIKKSPELAQSVAKDVQSPETIIWKNGASIMGITAASRAGQGAAGARGQGADWILVDEIDYMTDDDIIAIFAIAADANRDNEPGIIISSTPTGRRSKFFDICVQAQGGLVKVPPGRYANEDWATYYSPFYEHPKRKNNRKAIENYERRWRRDLGELGFAHECLAEFGEEAVGVFPHRCIERAKKDYLYPEKVKKGPRRFMGVDWDKFQATPTLCCIEYDPKAKNEYGEEGMFRVINRESIPEDEFVLDAGVNLVVEWNKKYQPEYIYVDRGYGDYQIEVLHKKGKQAEKDDAEWKLDERVVGVSFSETRDVKDPGTGEMVSKPIKPWMVNNTQILLERDRLIISKHDEVVWRQLGNYRVEKVSTTGVPRFTSTNEHAVDALMLCVLAVVDKAPDLTKVVTKFEPTRHMAIAPPLNTPKLILNRPNTNIDQDEGEVFANKRNPDKQTWFRVDDIRETTRQRNSNINKTTYEMFKKSPFLPRGSGSRRKVKRNNF